MGDDGPGGAPPTRPLLREDPTGSGVLPMVRNPFPTRTHSILFDPHQRGRAPWSALVKRRKYRGNGVLMRSHGRTAALPWINALLLLLLSPIVVAAPQDSAAPGQPEPDPPRDPPQLLR